MVINGKKLVNQLLNFREGRNMKKTEVNAYYKMLRLFFEINKPDSKAVAIPILVFLDAFHKFWNKYYSKEFNKLSVKSP